MRRHSARADARETRNRKNEWRITKMVLVIFLSFVACYLPITVVKVADKCVNYPGIYIVSKLFFQLLNCCNVCITHLFLQLQ